ncbi:MAG: DUF1972 domain-containing protein, partial [Lachnospiraceae bacterium]|nr:DUF1972 domain-containing protein [Lachnospiraceae bacterium]
MNNVQHVFLIGAKSLGAYGGYETFVDKLTEYHQHNTKIKYYVACKANGSGCINEKMLVGAKKLSATEFIYHNAYCFKITVPEKIGSAQAIYYDLASLNETCKIIKKENIKNPIVYIMACRIGPFIKKYYKKVHKFGGSIFLNPDGHEWMRAKWSVPIRKYWKKSEQIMVKYSDLVVCDSVNIEKYIHKCYDGSGLYGKNPRTTFIAYGAETRKSVLTNDDKKFTGWLGRKEIKTGEYYLAVGRFVPENNYEIMIREFMRSNSSKDFVIITTADNKFMEKLESILHFKSDKRIKFVGTVYDHELLKKIRENAYGYFHGHEVGGTNPSLLEALGSTNLNLLLDVGFNREVAEDAAIYWDKKPGNLANLINVADKMGEKEVEVLGKKAKERIRTAYSWDFI